MQLQNLNFWRRNSGDCVGPGSLNNVGWQGFFNCSKEKWWLWCWSSGLMPCSVKLYWVYRAINHAILKSHFWRWDSHLISLSCWREKETLYFEMLEQSWVILDYFSSFSHFVPPVPIKSDNCLCVGPFIPIAPSLIGPSIYFSIKAHSALSTPLQSQQGGVKALNSYCSKYGNPL